jgi:hypothetical protein
MSAVPAAVRFADRVATSPAPRSVDPYELGLVVARVASAGRSWRPYVRHETSLRRYVRLSWTPEYEVWLLCWSAGQAVELHDHGGSAGAFVVVQGALHEQHLDGTIQRPIRCSRGVVRRFSAGHVHTVSNPGPGVATSIHAYAPPLRSMTFYEHGAAGLRPTHVELVPKTATP